MRTLRAGIHALRRTPLALVPLLVEAVIAAALVLMSLLAADASSVPAAALFPLDVFFDVRTAITFTSTWYWVALVIGLSIVARAVVLSTTLWLASGRSGALRSAWWRGVRLAGAAAIALFPAAALFFVGVAIRYAPFVWLAAGVGVLAALLLARRAVRLDVGTDGPAVRDVPGAGAWLSYAYIVTAIAVLPSVAGATERWAWALALLVAAPIHAAFLLGWREHAVSGADPGGGTAVLVATVAAVGALFAASLYDRLIWEGGPVGRVQRDGTLLLLGGVDSTVTTGALADLDPRDVGFARAAAEIVSYRGAGRRHTAADTRRDLADISERVRDQVDEADPPRVLLGHSQASLIVDRLADSGRYDALRAAAVFAPAPPVVPDLQAPPPGRSARGKPGADLARAFATLLEAGGFEGFDIDAPASPVNLETRVVPEPAFPRLSLWAIADSVWLEGDWRRPGEVNIAIVSDHVGVTNNKRALAVVRRFFEGRDIDDDEGSWRGAAAALLGHAFDPWRPG